jgi:hypothetical protein
MTMSASILKRIIDPQHGGFSPEHARYVLSLDFSPEQRSRYADLADKVQEGNLTDQEQAELEEFISTSAFLTILQSKARISLKKHNPAA